MTSVADFLPVAITGGALVVGCLSSRAEPLLRTKFLSSARKLHPRISNAGKLHKSLVHKRAGLCTRSALADVVPEETLDKVSSSKGRVVLSCPVCFEPLKRTGPPGFDKASLASTSFSCIRCRRPAPVTDGVVDLTIEAQGYKESRAIGTSTFENPTVAYSYERGYRQQWGPIGFPGVEEEFKMASSFFEPVRGGPLLDVSCASGMFTRLFAKAGDFAPVVACDFSASMLQEARGFIEADEEINAADIPLIRADVARLPFPTGWASAVHAGAAIHCWPVPSLGVAEISRVLRPGGVFVGTTFLAPRSPVGEGFIKPIRKAIFKARLPVFNAPLEPITVWEEEDLKELILSCGFENFQSVVKRSFIMFTATKPIMG